MRPGAPLPSLLKHKKCVREQGGKRHLTLCSICRLPVSLFVALGLPGHFLPCQLSMPCFYPCIEGESSLSVFSSVASPSPGGEQVVVSPRLPTVQGLLSRGAGVPRCWSFLWPGEEAFPETSACCLGSLALGGGWEGERPFFPSSCPGDAGSRQEGAALTLPLSPRNSARKTVTALRRRAAAVQALILHDLLAMSGGCVCGCSGAHRHAFCPLPGLKKAPGQSNSPLPRREIDNGLASSFFRL